MAYFFHDSEVAESSSSRRVGGRAGAIPSIDLAEANPAPSASISFCLYFLIFCFVVFFCVFCFKISFLATSASFFCNVFFIGFHLL
jgi:hypothetical protein